MLFFQTTGIVIVRPENPQITEGDTLFINCTAANSTKVPGLNFTWSKVGEEIDLGRSSQLTIKNISRTDEGQYTCTGTNGTVTWTAVATVTVFCEYSLIIHKEV